MIRSAHLSIGALVAVFALAALPAFAVDPVNTSLFGVAMDGYDPVSYFTTGKPMKGTKAHSLEHAGATWRFASAENLALFRAAPARYMPQYGGYCAWAVSEGYTADGDPAIWKIVDGKLYLNYNQDVANKWLADMAGHIQRADANWPKILAKE